MSPDPNTLQFMNLNRRGYTPQDFLRAQFTQQNEELDRQRGLAMQALSEIQNASVGQTRSLIGRVQGLEVLKPTSDYVNALENQIQELQDFKEKGQRILDQQNSLLAERRHQQSDLKDSLKLLQNELAHFRDPIEDATSGYGERVSKYAVGWKDIPSPHTLTVNKREK